MFRHLDVRDGLPHSQVNIIHKDCRGTIWFGTASGLARYDGYTFRTFLNSKADASTIPGNYVECIVEDYNERLWICTDDNQYSIFDPRTETFNRDVKGVLHTMGIEGMPQKVFVDSDKALWLFVDKQGLFKVTDDALKGTTKQGLLPDNYLCDIGECAEGVLLVYDNGTLVCIDRETMAVRWQQTHITDDIGVGRYEKFYAFTDRDGDVWVYGSLGTWIYSTKTQRWLNRFDLHTGNRWDMVTAVTQDKQGRVWVGTNKDGLILFDKRTGGRLTVDGSTVNSLLADDDGTLWVGTYKKGVAYYNESIFKFSLRLADDVNCIEEAADGTLWLGTNDGGLVNYNLSTGAKTTYRHGSGNTLSSDVVVSLHRAKDGRLWIGTFHGGLNCFDGHTFRHWRAQEGTGGTANALANDDVWAIDEDGDGRLWIATLGGGVQRLDPQTGTFKTYDMAGSALITNHIASLCVTRNGLVVIGTASCGAVILDPRTDKITTIDSLSNLSINHVFEDSRGLVWIGTRDGLNIYDTKTKHNAIVSPRAHNNTEQFINAIAEDDDHNMWVTTSTGVMNITMTDAGLPAGNHEGHPYTIRSYDHSDGLQTNGFNQRSILRLSNGEIVMGGIAGVNFVHPKNIRYNTKPPRVVFTGLSLFDREETIGREYDGHVILPEALRFLSEVRLKHTQNMFTITFATDNYIQPQKATYRYRLEGFNDEYMTADEGEHSVTYTNLAPGTYTLCVRAINNDGYESTEEARLKIVIMPPFYMTPLAYAGYILLAAVLLLAIISFIRSRERSRFNLRQVEEEARKNDELNQMKFRFFTNVGHELRTPLTLIIAPLEEIMKTASQAQQPTLKIIHRNAQRLLNLVNQLLDFRKSEISVLQLTLSEDDIIGFVRGICDSFLELSERKNVNLTFYSAEPHLVMAFDGDKVGKIVMNLLSNAFKFTPDGGRVDVAVEKADDNIVIRVSDTGIGIKDEYKERIFERFFRVEEAEAAVRNAGRGAGDHNTGTVGAYPCGRPSRVNKVNDTPLQPSTTGSGIGLNLVKEYTEMHGGSVRVLNNVETGSVFVVTLPVRHVDKPAAEEVGDANTDNSDAPDVSVTDKSLPLALIVDDNADLVSFIRSSLSALFRIETAGDGREAWSKVRQLMPDIVVADLMMPGIDGSELCRNIKGDERTKNIPVIILTAKQRIKDQIEVLRIGADDYMTKPFNAELLSLRMLKLIDLSHKTQHTGHVEIEPSKIAITPRDEILVANAIKYVESNIGRSDLTVEELSKAMGMSRVHFYKVMLRITGKTPIEFIRIIRLKRAAQLLSESQLNVSEIAYRLGFNSPKYFTKYFSDFFGTTPSVYQKQHSTKTSIQENT